MGLGLLGRGVGDIAFLATYAKHIIVTDLKTAKELAPSLKKLRKFSAKGGSASGGKNITYHLGGHRLEDFQNVDLVIKAAGVPLDSPYITEARKNNIPVEMSTALFARLSLATVVGITGTRGKSTVTHLIYEILKAANKKVYLGGNVRGVATLPLLKKTKKGDIVVLELDSWQLQGFGEDKISPHISVFTTFMPDHLNYYKNNLDMYLLDKAQIFLHQKKDDYLVLGESVKTLIKKQYGNKMKGKIILPTPIPSAWKVHLLGAHNRENISLAVAVAHILKIPKAITKKAVGNFKGVQGRMELVKIHKGIKIYNDTTATTPHATIAALKALSHKKNVVLIFGGADKNIDMKELLKDIPKYCKALILLPGTGTDRILPILKAKSYKTKVQAEIFSLKEAVKEALKYAQSGDIILLSPAFASFGLFKNEFDRGDKFNELVKKLK